jgi:(p)ppGpp synthase/HD superfamily hydrolase
MPLHAITTMYGEQGLRDRLALETSRVLDPARRGQVQRALQLASQLHEGDRRQREPYVNHLLRVALRIMVHYGVWEPDVICAALLHDAVEDHAEELSAGGRPGVFARLAAHYGARMAELVAAVTNPVYAAGSDADRQYREHVRDSLDGRPWARVIKLSDFTDNGVGIVHTTGVKAERLARKYAPLVPVLAELAARADTPLADEVKVHVLGQLDSAARRFEVINAASGESV